MRLLYASTPSVIRLSIFSHHRHHQQDVTSCLRLRKPSLLRRLNAKSIIREKTAGFWHYFALWLGTWEESSHSTQSFVTMVSSGHESGLRESHGDCDRDVGPHWVIVLYGREPHSGRWVIGSAGETGVPRSWGTETSQR